MAQSLDIEDSAALLRYLRETARIGRDETPAVRNLAGGVSNRTVWLGRESGEAWVLKQALPRLRVQVEWFSDPRRIEREALGMMRLAELAPSGCITPLIFLDPAHNLLAMQAVPQPHQNWKAMLLDGHVHSSHVARFGEILGTIHRRAWERRDELADEFDDRSFFESLRLEPYYLYTARQIPEAADFLNALVDRTRAIRWTLVHGDYSPKNILVREDRLILLDHEVIHFGDGAFDLGFSLAHLLSKAHYLQARRGAFAAAALTYWERYKKALGGLPEAADLEERAAAHTLACLLARCRGRSPLEYLSETQRDCQTHAVLRLLGDPPGTIQALVHSFLAEV